MASTLIVYATREGQTEKVARRIADVLRSRGSAVDLADADHLPALDPSRFDLIIVGSAVHAQGYLRSVVRFVRKHRVTLERVPLAFFSVGLAVVSKTNDGRAQTREVVERFVRKPGGGPSGWNSLLVRSRTRNTIP
jgi:menaquinone-dependent protoporphyrinogen oxidase